MTSAISLPKSPADSTAVPMSTALDAAGNAAILHLDGFSTAGVATPVDAAHPLPVADTAVETTLTAILAKQPAAPALDGTDATGVSLATGATGIRGWLSMIWKALSGTQRTPALSVATSGGAIAAGATEVSFYNSGASAATVAGGSLAAGMGVTFTAHFADTLGPIAYDASSTTLNISKVA